MGFPELNGKTKVCGLLGYPVEHSFSPAMHNAAFNEIGLNWVYVPFNVLPENLPRAVSGIVSLNLAGVNLTVPHKQAVMSLLDEIDPVAKITGAVNTIVNDGGKLIGYNTDGSGFVRSLAQEAGFTPGGKTALVLGAGGAARAVAIKLALSGVEKLYLTNRSQAKAVTLASHINKSTGVETVVLPWGKELPSAIVAASDLVVQTTPIGMSPETDQCPEFPFEALHSGQVVCDLIYNPGQTTFLSLAAQRGVTVLNGIGMLLYQGVLAFELWTNQEAPVQIMKNSLKWQVSR